MLPRWRGVILCPVCGTKAYRVETRKTLSLKVPRVQLYNCTGKPQHFMETAIYILHVNLVGAPKKFINRMSTKGARAKAIQDQEDFDE